MALLSADAQLSKRYTNYSIRSTVIGILGELYEGCHVIELSGHKSESTIKQYARCLKAKTQREMCGTLAENVQAKKPKIDEKNFSFKAIKPAAASKAHEETPKVPENLQEPAQVDENLANFQLQPLDDAPSDDVLLQVLAQFENAANENQQQAPPPQPLASNNTMNIHNVHNVQQIQPPVRMPAPAMYFGGHSTVTINYNFGSNPQ